MPLGRHLILLAAEGCRHVLGGCILRANLRGRKTRRMFEDLQTPVAEGCRHVLGDASSMPTSGSVRPSASMLWVLWLSGRCIFIGHRAIRMANGQAIYQNQYSPRSTAGSLFRKREVDVHNRASWEFLTQCNHSTEVVK